MAVVGVIGCSEWDSSGDDAAWNSAYNWLDFSGVYSDAGQGVLIKDASTAFDLSSVLVVRETISYGDGSLAAFSSAFDHDGVVPGSVLIAVGEYALVDDSAGGLISVGASGSGSSGSGGIVLTETALASGVVVNSGVVAGSPIIPGSFSISVNSVGPPNVSFTASDLDADGELSSLDTLAVSGTIVYETGAWSVKNGLTMLAPGTVLTITYQQEAIDTGSGSSGPVSGSITYTTGAWAVTLPGIPLPDGEPLYATYRYTQNTSATDVSGSTGNPIYTMTILQTGEKLRIFDSNGNVYDGRLYDVNSTAGDLTEVPVSDVTSDTGDSGLQGEIVGSFYAEGQAFGQWVTMDGTLEGNLLGGNTLFDRRMKGTWRESSGKTGVFFGSAASTAVPLPVATPEVVINL